MASVPGLSPFVIALRSTSRSSPYPRLETTSGSHGDDGQYSVMVSNAYGSVTSNAASLAVLGDGANGEKPLQILPSLVVPPPQPNKDSLVFVTHGWEPFYDVGGKLVYGDVSWVTEIADGIRAVVPSNWEVRPFDWTIISQWPDPDQVRSWGDSIGKLYGMGLAQQAQWKQVHLIGHSAGAALIEGIAKQLSGMKTPPVIQETFLDAYTGSFLEGRSEYGLHASWADSYFAVDILTDYGGTLISPIESTHLQLPFSTSGQLEWAINIDVGGTVDKLHPLPVYYSGVADSTPPVVNTTSPAHGTPIDVYLSTIKGTAPDCVKGYGFPLSLEGNGSSSWSAHRRNNTPIPLCADVSISQPPKPTRSDLAESPEALRKSA